MAERELMENSSVNKAVLEDSFENKLIDYSISALTKVASTAKLKFDMERASNSDRIRWGHLIVAVIHEVGNLIAVKRKLNDLEERMDRLEELLMVKVVK